jgi:hypothetical protein
MMVRSHAFTICMLSSALAFGGNINNSNITKTLPLDSQPGLSQASTWPAD